MLYGVRPDGQYGEPVPVKALTTHQRSCYVELKNGVIWRCRGRRIKKPGAWLLRKLREG